METTINRPLEIGNRAAAKLGDLRRYEHDRISPYPLDSDTQRCPQCCWSLSWPECTKIARFSAVAAAIFTAPPQNRAIFKAPRCAISSAKKIASERRFSLRLKGRNLIPTAEFLAIPVSAAKIASERRCAILVHSAHDEHGWLTNPEGPKLEKNIVSRDSPRLFRGYFYDIVYPCVA